MTGTCRCGRTWQSTLECHCRTCHRHFTNVSAFDRHQPTRGGCPDPAELRERNGDPSLRLIDRGNGPIWTRWQSDEAIAATRRRFRPDAGL